VFGEFELYTLSPFNGNSRGVSEANKSSYEIGIDSEGRNKLTNL